MTATAPRTEERLARLDERVDGLEQSIGHVVTAVDRLSSKLDKAGQPQWQLLLGLVGLMVTLTAYVGTAWQAPLAATMARQQEDIRELKTAVVPRQEVSGLLTGAQRDNDLIRSRIERFENRVEKRLDRLDGAIFSVERGK
ncbi:hypothetical protein ABID82_004258 [Methylobacterium sp. PvP062]|uniref:DUF3618 domain-containing protein n=1 Tax=Methylobacterium radiotolerans TaxID=31998 RepID=A0ABV2NL71_9HYPH|nr:MULTISPECIES: hypothetical protein [unclassified Methylobacterium]KZC01422.1 hypothetical protein AU375_02346 [Methylobacterium radiotolerans]MBP2496020.1 hypothetical protein [Methylobacterium sp. PvP105]MBP2504109.1 hypothetical protein [Methylobacterium sp. PvP109]MCX7333101.1 hypothetical protein [Hyphomicrobiales bacterium]